MVAQNCHWTPSQKVTNISQGSVVTYLRTGGIFNNDITTPLLVGLVVNN